MWKTVVQNGCRPGLGRPSLARLPDRLRHPLPAELDERLAVMFTPSAVHPIVYGYEGETACSIVGELAQGGGATFPATCRCSRWRKKNDIFPHFDASDNPDTEPRDGHLREPDRNCRRRSWDRGYRYDEDHRRKPGVDQNYVAAAEQLAENSDPSVRS